MYEYKELYTLDFTNVEGYFHMHRIIKKELDFPDYYGENWDALWDCLTDMIGDRTHIEIVGFDVLENVLDEEDLEIFFRIFKRFKHYRNDKYADQILIEIVDGDKRTEVK